MGTAAVAPPPGFDLDATPALPPGFVADSGAPPTASAPPPRRQVSPLETALRVAGEVARSVVGHVDMAAGGLASVFGGQGEADRVFAMRDARQQRMREAYAQKPSEDFSTAGALAGGVLAAPMELAGGMGTQHGSERAAEVLDRGGSMQQATTAGLVTGGVRTALNVLPLKVGGRVGGAIVNRLGSVAGGAATGGVIAGVGGALGRATENAALPDGASFQDLQADPNISPADVGMGAAFGALPGVAGAATQRVRDMRGMADAAKVADALKAPSKVDAKADGAARERPEMEAIRAAHDGGWKLSPKAARAGLGARAVESLAGSKQLAQELSAHNSANTVLKAGRDVGLPDDVPRTREATQAVREEAGQDYAVLDSIGTFKNDEKYSRDLAAIITPIKKASDQYPGLLDDSLVKHVEALKQGEVATKSAIEAVRELRTKADTAFRAGDRKLGTAYRAAAEAVDGSMDRALGRMAEQGADPALVEAVDKYRAARVRIAKSYLLDDAMATGKDGEVNAHVYAQALKKGAKLTGEALEIAQFAKNFGGEGLAGAKSKSGSVGPTWHDIVLGALIHTPTLGMTMLARPGLRRLLASDVAQDRMAGSKPLPEVVQQEPAGVTGPPAALGDLTPDWQTEPGAAPGGAPPGVVEPTGLVRAIGEEPPLPQGIPAKPGSQIPVAENRPLGDLTPDWQTGPGVASGGSPVRVVEPRGIVPAVDDLPPPARVMPGGFDPRPNMQTTSPVGPVRPGISAEAPAPAKNQGLEMSAVEGRPDLPDVAVAGPQTEVAPDVATGVAMQSPDAALARRQQLAEVERVRSKAAQSPAVEAALKEHEALIERKAKAEADRQRRVKDAADLRQAAAETTDPELAAILRKRAEAVEAVGAPAKEKVEKPAKEKVEKPAKTIPTPEPVEKPSEVVQDGKRLESDVVRPAATAESPQGDAGAQAKSKEAPSKEGFKVGQVYTDASGQRAIYRADGSWMPVK